MAPARPLVSARAREDGHHRQGPRPLEARKKELSCESVHRFGFPSANSRIRAKFDAFTLSVVQFVKVPVEYWCC